MNPEEITNYIRSRFAESYRNSSATFYCGTGGPFIEMHGNNVIDTDEFIDNYLQPFIENELNKQYYTLTYNNIYNSRILTVSIVQLAFEDTLILK